MIASVILLLLLGGVTTVRLLLAAYEAFILGRVYGDKHACMTRIMDNGDFSLETWKQLLVGKCWWGTLIDGWFGLLIIMMLALLIMMHPLVLVNIFAIIALVAFGFRHRCNLLEKRKMEARLRGSDEPKKLFEVIN